MDENDPPAVSYHGAMTTLNEFGMPVKSLCFDPEHDRLLALGYPYLRFIEDPLPKAADAAKAARTHAYPKGKSKLRLHWPRNVAHRFLRTAASDYFQDWQGQAPVTPEDQALCDRDEDVSADEARALIQRTVTIPGCTWSGRYEDQYFLTEELFGTEFVVNTILDALDALPEELWKQPRPPNRKAAHAARVLGFLFRRLPEAKREAARERLRSFVPRMQEGLAVDEDLPIAVDVVLNGSKARQLTRTHESHYIYLSSYIHAGDDPERLRAIAAHKDTIYTDLDPQIVYLAGHEIFDVLGKHRPAAREIPGFIEEIGKFKHPTVVTLMVELIGRPTSKALPMDWLRAHEDFARPHLDQLAKGRGKLAEKAQMAQSML